MRTVYHARHGYIPTTPEAEELHDRAVAAGIPAMAVASFVTRIAADEMTLDEAAEALKLERHEEHAEGRRRAMRAYAVPEEPDDEDDEDDRPATERQREQLAQHLGPQSPNHDVKPSGQLAYLRRHAATTVHLDAS
jgi:hypothetical protein